MIRRNFMSISLPFLFYLKNTRPAIIIVKKADIRGVFLGCQLFRL